MSTNKIDIFEIVKWVTPVILFFLGLYFNKLSERIRENKRLRTVESYFSNQLTFLDKQLIQEINQLSICYDKLTNWESNDIILNQTSNRISERIVDIPQQDLFTIFLHRKKGSISDKTKSYNQITASIDFISRILPHMLDANKKANNELNNCYDKWNEILMSITKLHNSLIPSENVNPSFRKEFSQILNSFESIYKSSSNINNTYKHQIRPLIELCKKFPEENDAHKLMEICENAKIEYLQIKFIRESHTKFIEETRKAIKETREELEKRVTDFTNRKTKKNYRA